VFRSPIRRRSDGTYRFQISPEERMLVVDVVSDLRSQLTTDDPTLQRLFPPAYGDDHERNAGYEALAGRELVERRIAAIDTVLETAEADRLTQDQLEAWMRCVNDVRLVLGTRLDVDEHEDPGHDGGHSEWDLARYQYLGMLLELTVRALAD
jgi:hypothetical protein